MAETSNLRALNVTNYQNELRNKLITCVRWCNDVRDWRDQYWTWLALMMSALIAAFLRTSSAGSGCSGLLKLPILHGANTVHVRDTWTRHDQMSLCASYRFGQKRLHHQSDERPKPRQPSYSFGCDSKFYNHLICTVILWNISFVPALYLLNLHPSLPHKICHV